MAGAKEEPANGSLGRQAHLAMTTKPTLESLVLPSGQRPRRTSELTLASTSCSSGGADELTVCDITGDWGAYQWSLCLFAVSYSTLSVFVVIFGPMLMPDMPFTCQEEAAAGQSSASPGESTLSVSALSGAQIIQAAAAAQTNRSRAHDRSQDQSCFVKPPGSSDAQVARVKCTKFAYEAQDYGLMLTNGFDLVCDRLWLRSLISSSSLAGMLLSSVSMGLFSDKYGRLRCIQLGFVISILANVAAILVHNYYLFCACITLMSYAQIGAANALCTLVMEATSPRFRYVPAFEYSIGWAIGMALLPPMNWITHDYRWLMGLLLAWQLVMLPWLHLGVFESIRWLLSERHLNRAQIELRRACRMNRVETDGALAQRIAQMQAQQVRKASRIIEQESAPRRLSEALGAHISESAHELRSLNSTIKRCLLGDTQGASGGSESRGNARRDSEGACQNKPTAAATGLELSPSLLRASAARQQVQKLNAGTVGAHEPDPTACLGRKDSLTTQGLIQLAMKYSKTVQRQDAGGCFIAQMFHAKLWHQSVILLLISVMFETSYYGLLQANKFVGSSVDLNYLTGALSEAAAAAVTCLMLAFCSRRFSTISCMLVGSLICLALALTYHLIPDTSGGADSEQQQQQLIELRNEMNFYLVTAGKFFISVGIQVAGIIAMEVYPNNLRQTGPGAILFAGRLGSIVAPFLFNDPTPERLTFKLTLVALGAIGLLLCLVMPFTLRNTKDKELCDQLDEIE